MSSCRQCVTADTVATWRGFHLRRTTVRAVAFGIGLVVSVLWLPLYCRGSHQDPVGAVYTGTIAGVFWGLFERTCLHGAHEDRKIRVWLFFVGKVATVVVTACLVGKLLLYMDW